MKDPPVLNTGGPHHQHKIVYDQYPILRPKAGGAKSLRFTIGPCNQIIPEKAREIAHEKLLEMPRGQDPNLIKQGILAEADITLEKSFHDFVEVRSLKPTTFREYNRAMKKIFKAWQTKPVNSITKDMVMRKFRKVSSESGPALANLEFRFLRALMNFAMGQYENSKGKPLVSVNPVSRLSETKAWHRIKRRQTIIDKSDLPKWFKGIRSLRNEDFRDYLTLLLLTGVRRSEGFQLRWSDIDLRNKTFIIQDTKNHNPLSLPMGSFLYKMFKERKKTSKSEWVFPGTGRTKHMVDPKGALKKIKETTVATVTYSASSSFMYLDLSAIYPYAVGPGNVWAGLDIGINLSAESTVEIAGAEVSGDIEDVEMDYGLVFGYTYPINETMGVFASYYLGLAEIVADSKAKHNGIGLGISYSLPY